MTQAPTLQINTIEESGADIIDSSRENALSQSSAPICDGSNRQYRKITCRAYSIVSGTIDILRAQQ